MKFVILLEVKMFKKSMSKFLGFSSLAIVLSVTMGVLLGSIPTVYLFSLLFDVEYTYFFFYLSILLPLILTPPTILLLLSLSKNLKYFKNELDKEIEKNKKQELLLFEQARFALMGEMLANISHQWKQPLNTIGLSIVAAKTSGTCSNDADKYFNIMEDNINYLASTIDDFMSFFDKKTHLERRGLHSIVKEIKSIVSTHVANKGISLEIKIDESYGRVEVASSISQVVLNILNNAKDAIENDAALKEIKLLFITNEHGLEIECCDTGKGISEEIKDKIFNPYFTTKSKKQGTGIGLHMSKEIVQKVFDGQINVSIRTNSRSVLYPSDNSAKTCFFIALPYSEQCVLIEDFE